MVALHVEEASSGTGCMWVAQGCGVEKIREVNVLERGFLRVSGGPVSVVGESGYLGNRYA